MNRLAWTLFIAMLLMIGLKDAQADILLLNLNGATQEVAELKKLAASTGEKLYILPEQNGNPKYITADLTRDLHRLAQAGVRPRIVIASGHHYEDQYYYGSNGKVFLHKISEELKKLPATRAVNEFFQAVRSLYLWGCYTGTLANTDDLLNAKNSPFINAKYIVGFSTKGPLGTTAASGILLRESISREGALRTADPSLRPGLLKSALGKSPYDVIVHVGEEFFNRGKSSTRQQFISQCMTPEAKHAFFKATDLIHAYRDNVMGEIPDDTAGGPLRKLYEDIQQYQYCLTKNQVKIEKGSSIQIKNAIRLVYFKNVIKNFSKVYARQLQWAHQEMAKRGIVGSEFIMGLDRLTRNEMITKVIALGEQNYDRNFSETDLQRTTDFFVVDFILSDLIDVLYPKGERVPSSWTEVDAIGAGNFRSLNTFELAEHDAGEAAYCSVKGCVDGQVDPGKIEIYR